MASRLITCRLCGKRKRRCAPSITCFDCNRKWLLLASRATKAVQEEIKARRLYPVDVYDCLDCGKQAEEYDALGQAIVAVDAHLIRLREQEKLEIAAAKAAPAADGTDACGDGTDGAVAE